jgi:DNA-binding transcriptional regulator YiaG
MPNLAATLKEEIRRLAKKEVKTQLETTKKSVTGFRQDIARLKRIVARQEKRISFLESQEKKRISQPEPNPEVADDIRFSPRSVKAQRDRLGFSAAEYARLVGVSQQTIYNWEHGLSRPMKQQLATLASLRGIGKREAQAKLDLLKEGSAEKKNGK